jgi:ADP-ribose pyrophosphatase
MIPAIHGDKLVLIREYRVPIRGYVWGFPAGLIDQGERYSDTLLREIVEETGLTVKRIIRDDARLTRTSPGLTDEGCYFVFVEVEGTPSTENLEESEDIEVFLMPRKEVKKVIESGENIDSKAYLIMTRFVEDGKI